MLDQFGFGGEFHWELIVTASVITTLPMIIAVLPGPAALRRGHRHHRMRRRCFSSTIPGSSVR
jgi:ABC-type glycerol-3-phosphate transport system permease component